MFHLRNIFSLPAIVLIGLIFAAPVQAQITWDGGGIDNNWTTDANWVGDVAPNAAGAGDLIFNNNVRLTSAVDVPFIGITNIDFQNGAGAFILSGAQLSIDGPTATTGFITNDSTSVQTINNNILVTGGDLVLNGASADLIINGNIDNNGFRVQLSGFAATPETNRVNGVISGTGGIIAFGGGNTVFTGMNTFTGLVDIEEGSILLDGDFADTVAVNIQALGILTLGGDETIGSLAGDGALILGANDLIVGDATNTAFDGVISGTGSVTKNGTGTLTFTGANTFTGPLTINNGTVQLNGNISDTNNVLINAPGTLALGGDETLGSIAGMGNLNLNANTLTLGNGASTDFGGVISGTGALIKQGLAIQTLSGVNTFTGDTTVNGGTLNITGSVVGDVINNSAVSGTGTIGGNLTNNNASNVFPGTNGTIGTLNITNNLVQAANTDIRLDVSKDGGNTITNDLINVGGTATLAANSRITLTDLNAGGAFAPGDMLTILTAAGGIIDNGVLITFVNPLVVFIPQINGNNLDLLAVPPGDLRNDVTGAVNLEVARAIDFDTPLAMGDYQTFINALNALGPGAAVDAAMQSVNPTAYGAITDSNLRTLQHHASINSNYLESRRLGIISPSHLADSGPVPGSFQLASAATDPALLAWALQAQLDAEAPSTRHADSSYRFYGTAFGLFADKDDRLDGTGYDARVYGGQVGFDQWVSENTILGVLFGYDFSDVDFTGGGSAETHSIRFGPYLDWSDNSPGAAPWYFNGSITYGYHLIDAERTIAFGGFNGTPTADFNAHDISVHVGTGYDFAMGDVTLTPFASMQYTFYYNERFIESGGGGAALAVNSREIHSLRTLLGGRARGIHKLGALTVASEGFLAWGHEFLNDSDFSGRFANGTNQFTISPSQAEENSFFFGGGLSTLVGDHTSAFFRYEGEISSDSSVHAFGLGLTFSF